MQTETKKIYATRQPKPQPKKERYHAKKIALRQEAFLLYDPLPNNWKKVLFKHFPEYQKKNRQWFWNYFNHCTSDAKLNSILKRILKKELV